MAYHNNTHLIGHYLELLKDCFTAHAGCFPCPYFPPHHLAAPHLEIIEGVHKL